MTDRPADTRQSGFTLIELSIVLVIIGMVIAMFSHIGVGYLEAKQREATNLKLDAIEEALVRFVAATRRLPCPADATEATATLVGVERRDGSTSPANLVCANGQARGVVPWVTLGLPKSAAVDGWNNLISYRVYDATAGVTTGGSGSLVHNDTTHDAMNMRNCSLADTSLTPAQPNCDGKSPHVFLATKGLLVTDASSGANVAINNPWASPPTGAAYILISHGQDGLGAYTSAGVLRADPVGTGEIQNANGAAITVMGAASETNWTNAYYDQRTATIAGTGHFDDVARHRTILDVAVRAGLGPT